MSKFLSFTQREKWMAAIIGVIIILFAITIYLVFDSKDEDEGNDLLFLEEFSHEPDVDNEDVPSQIVIDVKGAVKQPGVYTMMSGERVIDAIEKAGGLLPDAEENQINLAGLLKDEMVIYVPHEGEEMTELAIQSNGGFSSEDNGKVRINHASAEELQQLQGIGPSKASAIIGYREEHGPFQTVEELTQVSGIGEKTLENIKDQITVD